MATKQLIIWAHPVPDSYSAALRDAVIGALEHPPEVIDLYRSGFDARYMTAAGADDDSNPNQDLLTEHRAKLSAAEELLFVYPTWWDGLPAILKSWLEQIFPDALDDPAARQTARQTLRGVKSVAAFTSHGSSKWVNFVQGQAGRKILSQSLTGLCDPKCKFHWVALYKFDRLTDRQRQQFLLKAARKVKRISDGA